MAAELGYGRHTGDPPFGAKQAAVIVPLYQSEGAWHVILTVRSHRLAYHSGQVSLPGGAVDPGETSRAAAKRELEEELGIGRVHVHVAGHLTAVYVFASNFHVTPWIAFLDSRPHVKPNPAEVSRVLEVPLAQLADPASRALDVITRGGLCFRAPYYAWHEHRIWGGTAMIVSELLALLHEATAPPSLC
jgi:8-oxo-dGTP pyrophosphatase MutT (NUDIX family)